MKIAVILIPVLTICCLFVNSPLSRAGQADQVLPGLHSDSSKPADLNYLRKLNLKQAFQEIKGKTFVVNRPLMNQALVVAFGHRKSLATGLACQYLRLPIEENVEGKTFSRTMDFYVAKSVLQAFPDVALERLGELYDSTNDAVTRGNIVLVLGGMEDDQRMWDVLLKALKEKEVYDGNDPEAIGHPLRVCDLAYNQIVAQYGIRDVLRTIGRGHSIDVRDYHIKNLRKLISD